MTDFLTRLCLACAAVLFAAWLALRYRGCLARATDALAKVSRARLAAFLFFVAVATVCAQKPGGGGSPSSQGGDLPRSGGGEAVEVTNLCFTGISVSSNEVVLSLAWPTNFLEDGSCLDFFAKVGSLTNGWEWIGCQSVSEGDTNLDVAVELADLPGATNIPSAAFFSVSDRAASAATMRDWDGDGIPDVYELHNGTNPYVPDAALAPRLADGDGVHDGDEVDDGTDPRVFGSFLRHVTVVATADDSLSDVTNYVAWGVAEHGWEANDVAALAASPGTNEFTVATSNATVYAKAYRDMNRNGGYDEGADILLVKAIPEIPEPTILFAFGDVDGDGVSDVQELAEGTDPRDPNNYCFNLTLVETGVVRTTNDLSVVVKLGDMVIYGPMAATNRTFEANVGHVVVTNGGLVTAYLWDDANTNGARDAEEPWVSHGVTIRGHENAVTNTFPTHSFDRDRDGMLDWWEELHSDAGLSTTNSADAWLDLDSDGLINLHEYWADCDPLVYDGTNTAIYAAVHSVDDGITGRDPELSMPIYVDYKNNLRTNNPPVAIINTNSWAASMLHGCFSLWSDGGNFFYMNEMNPISPYHVVMASHCGNPLNVDYKFMGLSGAWYTRQLVGKVAIPNTDITIGIDNEALPTNDLRTVYLLPGNYSEYLGTLIRLPVVQINQDKLAIVQEISQTATSADRYCEFECSRSSNDLRHPFGMSVRLYDSGSPCYLLIGDVPVLLYAIHAKTNYSINGSDAGLGYNTTLFCDEIQNAMNDLSDAKNFPRVGINFFDFSQYEQLRNAR